MRKICTARSTASAATTSTMRLRRPTSSSYGPRSCTSAFGDWVGLLQEPRELLGLLERQHPTQSRFEGCAAPDRDRDRRIRRPGQIPPTDRNADGPEHCRAPWLTPNGRAHPIGMADTAPG